jgi:hypothetical protein
MAKIHENAPALRDLKKVGFAWRLGDWITGLRNGYVLTTPTGQRRRMKIHKSRPASGDDGRHWFGVTVRDLDRVDDIVFWAEGERFIFAVPTAKLKELFQSKSESAKVQRGQWHMNIVFDQSRLHWIVPVGIGKTELPNEYAYEIED